MPTSLELETYFARSQGSTEAKEIELKLHPCLVDSDPTHAPIRYTDWQEGHETEYDALDQFSVYFNQLMRRKFSAQWDNVCQHTGEIEKLLKREDERVPYYVDQEGYLRGLDGSYVRNFDDVREAVGQALGNLSQIEQQLIFPTDYKQYNYDFIDECILTQRILGIKQ